MRFCWIHFILVLCIALAPLEKLSSPQSLSLTEQSHDIRNVYIKSRLSHSLQVGNGTVETIFQHTLSPESVIECACRKNHASVARGSC